MLWNCPGQSCAKNPSEESTPMNNSLDDTAKPSVTHAKGSEDVAGAFMQTVTSDTDASKGNFYRFEKGIACKYELCSAPDICFF